MQSAFSYLNEEQQQQVEQAVVAAEKQTSCEIVPVIATSSGRYDRPEDVVGLWLTIVTALCLWYFFPRSSGQTGDWGGMPIVVELFLAAIMLAIAFILGAIAGSRIGWLRRLFTPRVQMQDEVAARAREIFFDKRIHHTEGGTGILIYISLFEHMAVALADQSVIDKLGQSFLDQTCQKLTTGLHSGNPTATLCETILEIGSQASVPLPRAADDQNELQDALVLID
ncbi:TPM domain-containing protein [Gimesia sp.]|uniref:TPM domain-containing protein n=1 Tax=Gimesia sp. TaxID=2024833 RepID=UPI003A916C58